MNTREFTLILILTIFALIVVGCGAAEPQPTATPEVHPGKALVESRCGTCHGVAQVNNVDYSADIWDTTIDRMIQAGAPVNDEQKELIIEYLVSK